MSEAAPWQAPPHAAEAMGWRDVTWLRMEAPCNRMVIYWVAWLEHAPSLARLHALVGQRLLAYPRFAQRVARGLLGYRWEPVASLDASYHLQERVLPRAVDAAAVEASLADWVPEALDTQRPLWQWRLLRSSTNEAAALIVRHHHCMTDGDGLVHMLLHLSDDAAQAGRPLHQSVQVGDRPADFERAQRRVILVFDPEFASDALVEQRPRVLRSGRDDPVDDRSNGFNLGSRWER